MKKGNGRGQGASIASGLFGTYSLSYLLYEALRKRGESEGGPECDGTR